MHEHVPIPWLTINLYEHVLNLLFVKNSVMDRKYETSHKSIMRPLDFLYGMLHDVFFILTNTMVISPFVFVLDSTYTVSSEKSFYKMAARAANQISEKV